MEKVEKTLANWNMQYLFMGGKLTPSIVYKTAYLPTSLIPVSYEVKEKLVGLRRASYGKETVKSINSTL